MSAILTAWIEGTEHVRIVYYDDKLVQWVEAWYPRDELQELSEKGTKWQLV